MTNRQPRRRPSRPELSLLLWAAGQLKRRSRRRRWCGWVGRTHYWVRPPRNRTCEVHRIRLEQARQVRSHKTVRSARSASDSPAGPLTAAMAAASSCPLALASSSSCSSGPLTASARFRARAPGPVSDRLSTMTSWRGWPNCRGFPLRFRCRHSLLGHPLPAEELGVPHGRLTGQRPDPDGVSAFRTHEQRSGWVPSLLRGQRCSS